MGSHLQKFSQAGCFKLTFWRLCYISFCTKFTQEKGVVGGGEGGELFWENCAKNT